MAAHTTDESHFHDDVRSLLWVLAHVRPQIDSSLNQSGLALKRAAA